jgi:putative ABC transport system permease protein
MAIFSLAWNSLLNRRFTAALTVISIALSVALLVGVERLRTEARASFANTLSGTDLIVGARSGPVQLLLYSVFRIGDATHNMSWQSYRAISRYPAVAWSVPLSLGDSHRGFRVLGTSREYFERYHYARDRRLVLAEGALFSDLYDAVLGAEVADELGYRVGDPIVVAQPFMQSEYGIFIPIGGPSSYEILLLGALLLTGFVVGSIPAYRAYRFSLADGLSIRI